MEIAVVRCFNVLCLSAAALSQLFPPEMSMESMELQQLLCHWKKMALGTFQLSSSVAMPNFILIAKIESHCCSAIGKETKESV